jgi:ribosome-associated protein
MRAPLTVVETMEDANLISKTRRKKQSHDLQAVGIALTKLPADQLAKVELPERLREAIVAARSITKHEALRRQMQWIGKLMRHIDAAPIVAQLDGFNAPASRETAHFHRVEKWRDAILAGDDGIARFVAEFPAADGKQLMRLAAAAREEREAERPPKRFRELFQVLNALLADAEAGSP